MPFGRPKKQVAPLEEAALHEYALKALGRRMRSESDLRRLMQAKVEREPSGAAKIAISPIHVAHALAIGKAMGKRESGASALRRIRKGTAAKPAKKRPRKQPVTRNREGSSSLRVQPT